MGLLAELVNGICVIGLDERSRIKVDCFAVAVHLQTQFDGNRNQSVKRPRCAFFGS